MNKKEVTEIKKLFTKERCCLNRLCGCYVDADKNKVVQFKSVRNPGKESAEYGVPAGTGNGGWHTEKSAGAAGQ